MNLVDLNKLEEIEDISETYSTYDGIKRKATSIFYNNDHDTRDVVFGRVISLYNLENGDVLLIKCGKFTHSAYFTISKNGNPEVPFTGKHEEYPGDGLYTKLWIKDGYYHKSDEPAMMVKHRMSDDSIRTYEKWYKSGSYHRIDGPAISSDDGTYAWFKDGLCHNENGPASRNRNGNLKYFINGEKQEVDNIIDFSTAKTRFE